METFMKKLLPVVLVVLVARVSLLNAFSKRIYNKNLRTHLPDDSGIRRMCEQISRSWLLQGKSDIETLCDKLDERFDSIQIHVKDLAAEVAEIKDGDVAQLLEELLIQKMAEIKKLNYFLFDARDSDGEEMFFQGDSETIKKELVLLNSAYRRFYVYSMKREADEWNFRNKKENSAITTLRN